MNPAQITVLVGGRGRHLFETVRDPRITLVTSIADASDPDLIVFPCGDDRRFERTREMGLPPRFRSRVTDGSTGLVFDASTEGVPHKPDVSAALHQVLHDFGASPLNCVYVTQDRGYESDYRAHCAAIGVAPPVAILNHDYWIWYALKQFESDGDRVYSRRLAAFRSRGSRRERRFVSLNRTPRPTKVLFLLRLIRDGLWDAGFISFGGFAEPGAGGKPRPSAEQLARALPGFEGETPELVPLLDRLEAYGQVLFGMDRHGWKRLKLENAGRAADLAEYDESWFSVVTETEMRARPARITEKAIKPLLNFHPLLVLGNPGSLKMIRSFGFATFEEMFDESYDEELDPRRRFDLVYRQIVGICRLPEEELQRLESAVAEKLIFNAHWGLTRFAAVCRVERDAALVDDILRLVNHKTRLAPA